MRDGRRCISYLRKPFEGQVLLNAISESCGLIRRSQNKNAPGVVLEACPAARGVNVSVALERAVRS